VSEPAPQVGTGTREGRRARRGSRGHPGAAPGVGRRSSVGRLVLALLVPLAVATVVGLVLLWPDEETPAVESGELVTATVTGIEACPDLPAEQCALAEVLVTSGLDTGQTFLAGAPVGVGAPQVSVGDDVVLQTNIGAAPDERYVVVDFQRGPVLWVLAALFAVAVVALARWRGIAALVGLGVSLALLTSFVLPAVLAGSPPLLVATVGAAAIAIVTMVLAHGPSLRTGVALLGTLASLTLTAVLGAVAIEVGEFTGLADESSAFLQAFGVEIDPRGLLLAGLVIGALGVLDDVTITQTAAVAEVHAADPSLPRRRLLASGLRVGRDHVAATVNTLVLAYAGAALPLLLLFTLSTSGLGQVLTSELVATELVRTLVGAIGIVAAVPVTTALAAALLAGPSPEAGYPGRSPRTARDSLGASSAYPTTPSSGDTTDRAQ
jgi:uncharacterized membrane protein